RCRTLRSPSTSSTSPRSSQRPSTRLGARSGLITPELKGQRYALLRNPETMNDDQLGFVSDLLLRKTQLKTARAFHLKLVFHDFYLQPRRHAEIYLKKWCSWAIRSRVPAMVDAARTIRSHWSGVLRWFTSKITNGLLEGI